MKDAEAIWRSKSDEQLARAAEQLGEYTAEGQQIIKGEIERRGLQLPRILTKTVPPEDSAAMVQVVVTDIRIPFLSMVILMMKWGLAAIPVGLIFFALASFLMRLMR